MTECILGLCGVLALKAAQAKSRSLVLGRLIQLPSEQEGPRNKKRGAEGRGRMGERRETAAV